MLKCSYCGLNDSDTKDHIPPKNIFVKPFPDNMITVPSCKKCNSQFSKDDEYFMIFLTFIENTTANKYKDLLFEKVKRIRNRPQSKRFYDYLRQSHDYLSKITKSGLILPNQSAMNIDQGRIRKTLERIITGLVYKYINKRPVETHIVFENDYRKFNASLKKTISDSKDFLIGSTKHKIADGRVFYFRFVYPENRPEVSFCLLTFFGSSGFSMDTGLTYHNKKVSKSGNYQSF